MLGDADVVLQAELSSKNPRSPPRQLRKPVFTRINYGTRQLSKGVCVQHGMGWAQYLQVHTLVGLLERGKQQRQRETHGPGIHVLRKRC